METSIRHRIEKDLPASSPSSSSSVLYSSSYINNNNENNNNKNNINNFNYNNNNSTNIDSDDKKVKIIYPYNYKYDLLYAMIPLVIILLIFGGQISILSLCFGCLLCYIFDILDFIEVSSINYNDSMFVYCL
jgi:hypothetical protein